MSEGQDAPADPVSTSGDYRGSHSTYRTRMMNFKTELTNITDEFRTYHKTLEEQGTIFDADIK